MKKKCTLCKRDKSIVFEFIEACNNKNKGKYKLSLCSTCCSLVLRTALSGIDGDLYDILIIKYGIKFNQK